MQLVSLDKKKDVAIPNWESDNADMYWILCFELQLKIWRDNDGGAAYAQQRGECFARNG